MADRRSITEGLKATPNAAPVDPLAAREFIHGVKTSTPGATGSNPGHAGGAPTNTASTGQGSVHSTLTRVPISTRIREDFAKALKRASLQRQLEGIEPSTLQDILEEAVEPWLRNHKYFP
jgi:hypothetical protein